MLHSKEAYHVFKYYATGRYNLGYILGTLELCKRQDLFTTVLLGPLTKENDKVAYEIPIKQESPNPVVLMLCRTSQIKTQRANHLDVKTLTKVCEVGLPPQYTLLAESQEAADFIINPSVLKLISTLSISIDYIYITDQVSLTEGYSLSLTSSFLFPKSKEELPSVTAQAQLAILIADLTSKLNLSSKAKITAEKERNTMNKEKEKEIKQQRDDERLQKKYEQKKKEEEKMQNLSKEKKRKLEEKEYKKELKKKGLKFKMIKG